MLAVISPAKTLDFTPSLGLPHTQPSFVPEQEELIKRLRELSPGDIGNLMSISEALSELNKSRYEQWSPSFSEGEAKQAVLAFRGDVYQGLDAGTLDEQGLQYAQGHLRILSGLYGLLYQTFICIQKSINHIL